MRCYCAVCGFAGSARRVEALTGIIDDHLIYCTVQRLKSDRSQDSPAVEMAVQETVSGPPAQLRAGV